MIANTPGVAAALVGARQAPGLELGLHFNLTAGAPVAPPAEVPSLCDSAGRFLPLARLIGRALTGRIKPEHVRRECQAQLERLRSYGVGVTHLDSHRHVHVLPGIWPVVAGLAAEQRLLLRVPVEPPTDSRVLAKLAIRSLLLLGARGDRRARPVRHFRGLGLLGAREFANALSRILDRLPPGGTEIMVHPGYVDGDLIAWDHYGREREGELRALCSPQVLDRLRRADLRLVRFAEL